MFNIVASAFFDKNTRDAIAQGDAKVAAVLDNTPRSVSIVLGPNGLPISEIKRDEEGILYADIDVAKCVEPKQFHDVAGYYNRFDVFSFSVDRTHRDPAAFVDMPEPQALQNDTHRQEMQDEITGQQNKSFRHKHVCPPFCPSNRISGVTMTATPHYKVDKVSVVFKSPDIQVREYEVLAGQEIPWHFHSQITDHCYCLAGAISVEVQDGRTSPISNTVLKPGEKCVVKPGVAHRVTCAQGVSARYLLVQGGGQYDFNPLAGK